MSRTETETSKARAFFEGANLPTEFIVAYEEGF